MIDVREQGVEIPTVLALKRDYEEERKWGEVMDLYRSF